MFSVIALATGAWRSSVQRVTVLKAVMSNMTKIGNVIPNADVVKRGVRLGAEVRNIRLSGELPDDALRAIGQLLLEHKVLFFRDQEVLDEAEQERFSVRLGMLIPSPQGGAIERMPSILEPFSSHGGGTDQGRADVMFDDLRNVSVLRAITTTAQGGDTVWSDMAAAYLDLPLSLRMLADELWAVHTDGNQCGLNEQSAEANETQFETKLPVVRTHPQTGERTLILGSFVRRFVGLQTHTGQKLLELLQSYIKAPHNTVRWRWRQGDVAIWDKRLTQWASDPSTAGDRDALGSRARPGITRVRAQKPNAAKARAA